MHENHKKIDYVISQLEYVQKLLESYLIRQKFHLVAM